MTIFRRGFAALAALGLSVPKAGASRTRLGEVAALTGEARADFSGMPTRLLALRAPLLLGDLVSTGVAARLACRLEGGLEIRLGERASLRIDALTLQGPRAGTSLRVFDGPVLLDRPPQAGTAPIDLRMPWARIGVRGTRFFAGPLEGRFAVFVARGRVAVEAGGGRVELAEGEGVDIAAIGAPPGAVVNWSAARIERAMASVE